MTSTSPSTAAPPLYAVIADVLGQHIRDGHLPTGLVLLEQPIAEAFQTSRAPVQRALAELETRRLIHRFAGRGFLVGAPAADLSPLRMPFKSLALSIGATADAALQIRTSWERVYGEVEHAVASCLVFGRFRIIEAELADHFGFSRTVARDVLGRLQERGLIRKNQSSHWIAGPLTAKDVRELYEMRTALEPVALRGAAAAVTKPQLEAFRERCVLAIAGDRSPADIDRIEADLHQTLLSSTTNERLADNLRHVQLPLLATERFLRSVGLPIHRRIAEEHRVIYELLAYDSVDAAAAALVAHLNAECRRSIIQLKTLAVISELPVAAPYLTRLVG